MEFIIICVLSVFVIGFMIYGSNKLDEEQMRWYKEDTEE